MSLKSWRVILLILPFLAGVLLFSRFLRKCWLVTVCCTFCYNWRGGGNGANDARIHSTYGPRWPQNAPSLWPRWHVCVLHSHHTHFTCPRESDSCICCWRSKYWLKLLFFLCRSLSRGSATCQSCQLSVSCSSSQLALVPSRGWSQLNFFRPGPDQQPCP